MINNAPVVNPSGYVATLSDAPEKGSRHLAKNQSAAMKAALMIGGQYSHASKSQFRRECLDYLKASLAPAQDVPA
ncbi:hypothetical protein SAMN04490179_4267 [Pseudomonas antarctica]|uniref:Uncharacterized protein n=1 Tax=Pseudomonas antarctica TaxID=219572 RepID=A0A1H0BF44_9PSED|nr:hypothetical protein [Pseudomonas antarctica]KAF2406434.1 hypothetical protein PSAN_46090 [Pseudomonas antarctica]SDN44225.1 hypothetical protein SAMN04490179_4267 [Pseudomonas antarctica]